MRPGETNWGWAVHARVGWAIPAGAVDDAEDAAALILGVKVVSDGPIYHLYFAARWWKGAALILVAAPFGENAATYFPANGDSLVTG